MIYPQVREEPIVDRNTFTNYPWTGQICSFFQLLSAPPIKQNVVDFRWQFHAPGSGFLPKPRVFRALTVGANYGFCSLKELRKLLRLQYAAPFPLPWNGLISGLPRVVCRRCCISVERDDVKWSFLFTETTRWQGPTSILFTTPLLPKKKENWKLWYSVEGLWRNKSTNPEQNSHTGEVDSAILFLAFILPPLLPTLPTVLLCPDCWRVGRFSATLVLYPLNLSQGLVKRGTYWTSCVGPMSLWSCGSWEVTVRFSTRM